MIFSACPDLLDLETQQESSITILISLLASTNSSRQFLCLWFHLLSLVAIFIKGEEVLVVYLFAVCSPVLPVNMANRSSAFDWTPMENAMHSWKMISSSIAGLVNNISFLLWEKLFIAFIVVHNICFDVALFSGREVFLPDLNSFGVETCLRSYSIAHTSHWKPKLHLCLRKGAVCS